ERAEIRNHRFLRRMVNQAKTEDGELRERLGCRRSSRISPSFSSAISDLGVGRSTGLPTVVEIKASKGLPADEMDGSCLSRDLPSPGGVSDVIPPICHLVAPLLSTQVEMAADCSAQGGDVVHPVKADGGSADGGLVDDESAHLPVILVKPFHCPVIPETGSSDVPSMDSSAVVLNSVMDAQVAGLVERHAVAGDGQGGLVEKQTVPSLSSHGPPMDCGQQVPRVDGQVLGGDNGVGGGNASEGVGRSYGSAVGMDRRSDVLLHFVSSVIPVDGEELYMLDSDRDELEWDVCLVGHFLQSGVPFSIVRPRLLHLWRAAGLVEVRSLDVGFFLF
ncbi:hypothetical protein Dimus_036373, partial [Dionaea muscipula]